MVYQTCRHHIGILYQKNDLSHMLFHLQSKRFADNLRHQEFTFVRTASHHVRDSFMLIYKNKKYK